MQNFSDEDIEVFPPIEEAKGLIDSGTYFAWSSLTETFPKEKAVKNSFGKTVAKKEEMQADALFYQGELLKNNDDLKKALMYYKAAERVARISANHDTVLNCLLRQTRIYLSIKNSEMAISKAREGLAYSRLLERNVQELDFILLHAKALRQGKKLDAALESVFEGIEISSDASLFDRESDFVIELAEISLERNDTRGALRQANSLLRRAILVNNTTQVGPLAALVDRISSPLSEGTESKVASALKNLPPLKPSLT